MSKKLTTTVFLILSVAVISWLASAAVAAEPEAVEKKKLESKEAQIPQLKEKIQQLKHQLELGQDAEKSKALKDSLREHEAKLERLMAESKKSQKPKGEFPEIKTAIRRAKANLKELRQAAEALQEEGSEPEKLEAMKKKIARKEAELKELNALLKQRREKKRAREGKEVQITRLQGAIKELESALEHNPNSEKTEAWKGALKENKAKLERLMTEKKPERKAREKSGAIKRERNIVTGWVISRTEADITIEKMEGGKVMVLKIPLRRQKNSKLARTAAKLQRDHLIVAKYREGDELERHGVYYLQNVKNISFSGSEQSEQTSLIGKMNSLERRLDRIEKALRELLGRERKTHR